jgi:hypothetical protein
LPAPFAPSTPIFAPGKNASVMCLEDHAVDADHLADVLHRVDELVRHNDSMCPLDGLRSPSARCAQLAGGAYSIGLALALLVFPTASRSEPEHPEVLVVVNDASTMSVAIGEAYRALRRVSAQNVVHLRIPDVEERIDRAGYTKRVRDPIAGFLREHDRAGRIRIVVTTTGVPLRVEDDDKGRALNDRRTAAVDAELAVMGSPLEGRGGIRAPAIPTSDRACPSTPGATAIPTHRCATSSRASRATPTRPTRRRAYRATSRSCSRTRSRPTRVARG